VKQIKVSDDVHEQLLKIAEKNGVSVNDAVKMLLNLYLGGSSERVIDKVLAKEFVADSEKICSKCRRKVEVGEVIYWIKYVYSDGSSTTRYFCFECANPSIAKIYRKKREMEIVVKQLKAEADRLAEDISRLEHVKSVYELRNDVIQFWRLFKNTFSDNPDYKAVETFLDKFNEIVDRLNRVEAFIESIKKDVRLRKEKVKAI